MHKYIRAVVLVCFAIVALLSGCSGEKNIAATTTAVHQAEERDFAALDLGEIPEISRRYYPESEFERQLIKLTAVYLSDVAAEHKIDGNTVTLTLLPLKSQLGDTLNGEDVARNFALAYAEDVNKFNANIIKASFDGLSVSFEFDREVNFERDYMKMPIYPIAEGAINSADSYGDYYIVSGDSAAQRVDLVSNTAKKFNKLRFVHYGFETARQAIESKELDILLLPHINNAQLWAETLEGAAIIKRPSDYVYMLGFGQLVDYSSRKLIADRLVQRDFIDDYLAGFADTSTFPVGRQNVSDEVEEVLNDGSKLKYLCFIDSEWSYSFSEYLEKILAGSGVDLEITYTDFRSMLSIAQAEDSEYVYAFAWDLGAGTDLSILLGPEFGGIDPGEIDADLYNKILPAIPIAVPFSNILLRSAEYAELLR